MPHAFDPGYVAEPFLSLCAELPRSRCLPARPVPGRVGPDLSPRPPRRLRARPGDRPGPGAARNDRPAHPGGRSGPTAPGACSPSLGSLTSYVMHQHLSLQRLWQRQGHDAKDPRLDRLPQPLARCAAGRYAGRGRDLRWERPPTRRGRCGRAHPRDRRRRWPCSDHAPDAAREFVQGRQGQARRGHDEAPEELEHRPADAGAGDRAPRCRPAARALRRRPGPTVIASPSRRSDFPAGLPTWMHEQDGWAQRVGQRTIWRSAATSRSRCPKGIVP